MAKKATRSRGKFVVLIRTADGSAIDGASLRERTLDGGVGGVKDRRAAGRLAFYWLHDNGHAVRPEATRLAAKLEEGGSVDAGRFRLTITEQ